MERAARTVGGGRAVPEIGWVKKVGEGLSRDVFAAEVEIQVGGRRERRVWAALIPRPDAPGDLDDRVRREAALLARLAGIGLPFRVPGAVAIVDGDDGLVLVREFVPGIEVDLRAGRMPAIQPWGLVAEIASAIHRLDANTLRELVPGHATRRAAAEARLQEVAARHDVGDPLVRDTIEWARAHLPPEEPATVVHGDLLGQNILLDPNGPPAVIDWEFAHRGDPAYDLAIVTRGARRPFQVEGGLEKLFEAYNGRSDRPLRERDVRLHEVCLHLGWYADALEGVRGTNVETAETRLESFMRAAERLP
jgi:aminoglycoside phosphotransferase (APT) family kinase protein